MNSSFTLFRVRGIEIGANWSWVFVLGLIVFSLRASFEQGYPGYPAPTYMAMALTAALFFFGSLILHELGHAFRAIKEGMAIEGITLWLFGGVAKFKGHFPSAGAEFRIAIAGPLVSLVLALAFWALSAVLNVFGVSLAIFGVTSYLAFINMILLAFNMIPALPLDGGRVLRAFLWHRRSNFVDATVSAARGGRTFGGILVGLGVLSLFTGQNVGGIWLALIGWFLIQAARAEETFALFRQALSGVGVRDLMLPAVVPDTGDVPVVESDQDVTVAIEQLEAGGGRAIVTEDGVPIGVLTSADVDRALERARSSGSPRRSRAFWVTTTLGLLVAGAYLYHPPVVIVTPGQAFDVVEDITIEGIDIDEVDGQFLLTSVAVEQRNLIGLTIAMLGGEDVIPIDSLIPADVDPEEYFEQQRELFAETQLVAAAAAAQAAGIEVSITGTGAEVVSVSDGSPARDVLEVGDVVVASDGEPIDTGGDLQNVVRSRPAGTTFDLVVERGDRTLTRRVTSRSGVLEGVPAIGVSITTRDFDSDLPFDIEFEERAIGGPSAGLAYALAIYDLLDPGDTARGRIVATTGEITFDGRVRPVGGVSDKAIAAQRAGAELFLVPETEVDLAPGDLDVRGVSTLADALEALA